MKSIHLIIYKLILVLFFSAYSQVGVAQTNPQNDNSPIFDKSKFYIGGNLGLSFGSVSLIYIAPVVTYDITEDFHVGVGASYEYYSNRNFNPIYNISTYGGKAFARYYLFQDLFAHVEFDKYYYKDSYYNPGNTPLLSVNKMYAGGGYRQWIGANAYTTIMLLFDLTNNNYILGENPIIRVGMAFGL